MMIWLLSVAALLAATTPAHADPVGLAIAGINALLGTTATASTVLATIGTASITVGGVVSTALAVGGSLLAATLFKPSGGTAAIDPSAGKNTFETAESGEIRCIGRARVGGVKLFGNTSGENRMRLIAHSRGQIDGVEQHYLGGREVVVDVDGAVSSPPYARPGGSYVSILSRVGDGTETAWGDLVSLFPTLWTSDHKVHGIAQSVIKYINPGFDNPKYLKLYQSGAPEYERVQRGELLYDPRSELTAWSDNGVLAVLHIMLGMPEFSAADFDMAFVADEADRADAIVATRTGTEKRSRAWGLWDDYAVNRGDLLRDILLSTGCEIVPRPGDLLGIRLVDDERPAEVTIPKKHIVEFTLKSGPEGVERPNRCRVKYYSPERSYQMAEVNLVVDPDDPAATPLPWSVAQDEIDRFSEIPVEYSLPFCPSAAQAQRIARRLFETARADSGMATMNMVGLALWGTRTAAFEVPDLDLTLVCEVQPARVDDASGTVEAPFVVAPYLEPWNPALHEAMPPDVIPDMGYESDLTQPDAPGEALVVLYPSGGIVTRFPYSRPSDAVIMEASYRDVTGSVPGPWSSMIEYEAPGGFAHAYVAVDLRAHTIEERVRSFDADENGSLWSPVTTSIPVVDNTAPSAPTFTHDEEAGEVEFFATAPNELRVAALVITGPDAPGTMDARPGEVFSFDTTLPPPAATEQTLVWTATALSSDGSPSATVTITIVIPENET